MIIFDLNQTSYIRCAHAIGRLQKVTGPQKQNFGAFIVEWLDTYLNHHGDGDEMLYYTDTPTNSVRRGREARPARITSIVRIYRRFRS